MNNEMPDEIELGLFYAPAPMSEYFYSVIDRETKMTPVASAKYVRADKAVPEGWKPIETAPKDGTVVLGSHKLASGKYHRYICFFVKKHTEEEATGEIDPEFCDEHNGSYYWPEGWYCYQNMNDEIYMKVSPTHWMPLLQPPTTGD